MKIDRSNWRAALSQSREIHEAQERRLGTRAFGGGRCPLRKSERLELLELMEDLVDG